VQCLTVGAPPKGPAVFSSCRPSVKAIGLQPQVVSPKIELDAGQSQALAKFPAAHRLLEISWPFGKFASVPECFYWYFALKADLVGCTAMVEAAMCNSLSSTEVGAQRCAGGYVGVARWLFWSCA
jgi:hypothetical protein